MLIVTNPEVDAKRAELTRLSKVLARVELELEDAKSLLATFNRRYFAAIGDKYVVLDDLRAQVAERLAARDPEDVAMQEAASFARERASETARIFESSPEFQESLDAPEASHACKATYRRIATIVHPDKTLDSASKEVRTRLMSELNDAYARRDMERMKAILASWQHGPDAVAGVDAASDLLRLARAIAQMESKIAETTKTLDELLESEMYRLMTEVHTTDLEGRDMLAGIERDLEESIGAARRRLARL